MFNNEYPYGFDGITDHSRRPYYNDETDYNTNAPSYYDDLARKEKLIKYLATKIGEYDKELEKRFLEWDKQVKDLPITVEKMLVTWLDNGKLQEVINENIFSELDLRTKLNRSDINTLKGELKKQYENLKENDDKLQSEIDILSNKHNVDKIEMNHKIDKLISPMPLEVLDTLTMIKEKYPNGKNGIIVNKEDKNYYYYDGDWKKGGLYIDPLSYQFTNTDGTLINLNLSETWLKNPDITTLKAGYYNVFIQNEVSPVEHNPNYPIVKNSPKNIRPGIASLKVYDYGNEGRFEYEIVLNYPNNRYVSTLNIDGKMNEWKILVTQTDDNPNQQHRLTYSTGEIMTVSNGNKDNPEGLQLLTPITDLNTGHYYASINLEENIPDRKLPKDFLYGQICSINVYKTSGKRTFIELNALYSGVTWHGYSGANYSDLYWKRVGDKLETKDTKDDLLDYSYKINKLDKNKLSHLIITDTHILNNARTNEQANINGKNFEEFIDLNTFIKNIDCNIHLGDWIDGNYPKNDSIKSVVETTRKFYSLKNSYGVIGNHDFNAQWNGYSGNNGIYNRNTDYILSKEDMVNYYVPEEKDYYFKDDEKNKIRMIFLNSFDISYMLDKSNQLLINPLEQACFGGEQVRWYIETLKTLPNDYNIIIYTHETFDNVYKDSTYYNGDTMRKITEGFQNKKNVEVFTSDVTEMSPYYSYYRIETSVDFSKKNGKILAVISGHRHVDDTIFKGGIRYISLLHAKGQSRPRFTKERNAISYVQFDMINKVIEVYRYGNGKDLKFKMFEV